MPRYLIERAFALANLPTAEIVERNTDAGVTWLHSYVSRDQHRSFDVYDAPSPEAVRRASTRNGLDVDSITEVSVLDPYCYQREEEK
jgi:Nickel responsive protein SCO4226-like